ncbi:MAG: hypothetical protein SPK28_02280 [Bacilli bacterium]|nr:hypothetical protein [Bacilli bacterium]
MEENVLVEKKERKYTIYSLVVFALSLVCFGLFVALILIPSLEFINSMKNPEGAEGLGVLAIMMLEIYFAPCFLVVGIMGLISLGISKKKQKKRLFDSIATLLAFVLIVLSVILFVLCTKAANSVSGS